MKLAFLLSLLFLTLPGQGAEIKLATITNDIDRDLTVFFIETMEDGTMDSMRYLTTMPSGQISEDMHFPYEQVLAGNVLLEERNGYEVIKLSVEKFSRNNGGIVRLSYLFNGITNSWRELRLNLIRDGLNYYLTDLEGRKINRLHFRGNYIRVVGLVGIRDILISHDSVQAE